MITSRDPLLTALIVAAAVVAAAAPSLLAYNVSPSPTAYNQALAMALWAGFVFISAWPLGGARWFDSAAPAQTGAALPVWLALVVVAAGVLFSWGWRGLPSSLALSALALLAGCALLATAGAAAGSASAGDGSAAASERAQMLFAAFCWAWVLAGLASLVVASVQVFAPALADGRWVVVPTLAGRAIGNLRQPNHLSSLFMWAGVATVGLLLLQRLAFSAAAALLAAFSMGVVLTASRTGLLSVLMLAAWGLLDRRQPPRARLLLLASPLLYAAAWWGLSLWASASQATFGGEQRLAEVDISGSRFGIWINTLQLIAAQPWAGVGFGNFNLAWTLTPFPGRPVAFFDHSHNLPLQLAAELGLPATLLCLGLLGWAMWRGWRRPSGSGLAPAPASPLALAGRSAWMMVLMIGLHSLLEYPLWYAYFLLPAGWALGFACGAAAAQLPKADPLAQNQPPPTGRGALAFTNWLPQLLAVLMGLGAVFAVIDYRRVTTIFSMKQARVPLVLRIEGGQHSVFYSHHADYAAATSGQPVAHTDQAFDRASRYLLDTRLMIAWARALEAQGDIELARNVAARLREFRKTDAADFFEPCPTVAEMVAVPPAGQGAGAGGKTDADAPFQCQRPAQSLPWQRFLHTAKP